MRPPIIPTALIAPAAAVGGGAVLLFLLFGSLKRRGRKSRGVAGTPRVTSRIVSDGRADQSLIVKWKKR
jgi:hypothetical protein